MNKLLVTIIILVVFMEKGGAQMITTVPSIPTAGQEIKIFYDSSKDQGDLHNYTLDLYAHTGVTLQGDVAWQKVIGTWANNANQPKFTYLGNYRYELDISPDLKTFYALSASDVVTKIDLVVRNATGTLQTRPDIFIDIFTSGLNVSLQLPVKSSFVVERYSTIAVKANATQNDSVSLYINGKFISSGSSPTQLNYTIFNDQYGEFRAKVVAWKKPSFSADSFFYYVRKPQVTEALPGGISDGINYSSNTSVILVLHAPYKNYVFVKGDFNNWLPVEKGYMKRTPDNERYWITIDGLLPGKEYRFQYQVDSALLIADPYAEKILDPDNDRYISSSTYPDLISYPKDTTTGIVSVLQTAQVPYSWQTTGFRKQKTNLRIYELLVRDFTQKHDFKTISDSLNYLVRLGINAIELMPVNEFEGNSSWGYNPSFYFAPDKYYGTKNDLKSLIDKCHKLGIAVIIDMVLNHSMGQSPFVQLYLDHYGTDQIYMKTPNPWFNASSPNTNYKFGADFNHESIWTQKLVDRINSFWLTEYKVDGFRFDFTKGFTNTPGEGTSYDASRIAILKRMAGKIWSVSPEAYVILEHFCDNTEEKELSDNGMMLWGNINHDYSEAAMGFSSDLSRVSSRSRGWTNPDLVSYMESHDEERIMYNTLTYGAESGAYNTRETKTALNRMALDAVFFLTVPGPKMIWQFGELGYDVSINFNGRTGEKPIRWDYYSNEDRHRLYLIYSLLNDLRQTQPVFSTTDYTWSLSSSWKNIQLNHPTMIVNVVGNFGVTASTNQVVFNHSGTWYEYFTGDSLNLTGTSTQLLLQPGEYRLYTSKRLPSVRKILGLPEQQHSIGKKFVSVYPNPSKEESKFHISDSLSTSIVINIYDINGRLIKKLQGILNGVNDVLIWNGKDEAGIMVNAGLYFARVATSSNSETVKVLRE